MTSIFMRQILKGRKKHRLHLTLQVMFKILEAVTTKLLTHKQTKMADADKEKKPRERHQVNITKAREIEKVDHTNKKENLSLKVKMIFTER